MSKYTTKLVLREGGQVPQALRKDNYFIRVIGKISKKDSRLTLVVMTYIMCGGGSHYKQRQKHDREVEKRGREYSKKEKHFQFVEVWKTNET